MTSKAGPAEFRLPSPWTILSIVATVLGLLTILTQVTHLVLSESMTAWLDLYRGTVATITYPLQGIGEWLGVQVSMLARHLLVLSLLLIAPALALSFEDPANDNHVGSPIMAKVAASLAVFGFWCFFVFRENRKHHVGFDESPVVLLVLTTIAIAGGVWLSERHWKRYLRHLGYIAGWLILALMVSQILK